MKLMKTEDAVGQVLCHDITQIIKLSLIHISEPTRRS